MTNHTVPINESVASQFTNLTTGQQPSLFTLEGLRTLYFPQPVLDFLSTEITSISGIVIDFWMLIHGFAGMALGYSGIGLITTSILLVAFELFEVLLVSQGLALPETIAEQGADVLVGLVGWVIGQMFHD